MTKQPWRVVASYNFENELRCVDLFKRDDGTFGFEVYRRDPEDNRGWFPVGHLSGLVFTTVKDAEADAVARVAGLQDVIARSRGKSVDR